jgi:lysophospholipid acyltransferase (LPLAT)-like uncharacterized protein
VKRWWRAVRPRIVPPLAYAFARLLGSTLRVKAIGFEEYEDVQTGVIFAGWHGLTLVPALFFRGRGFWTIISRSRDGEMQNQIFNRLGFHTIRGSTGRSGARAAVESIRVLKNGATMAFTPDGPRGPSGIVQPGIVVMAKRSGAALVPVGVSASWKLHAPTWDRYMVPMPFARCIIVFGEPLFISKDASDVESEEVRLRLEKEINRTQAKAEASFKKSR